MASKQSLRKIGEEAFKLIDQPDEKQRLLYHPTKPITVRYRQPPHMSNHVHKADQLPAQNHSGYYHVQVIPSPVLEKEYHGSVMDSNEAARIYGGMVLTDHYYPNKRIVARRNNRACY